MLGARSHVQTYKIVAKQQHPFVFPVNGQHQDCSDNRRDSEADNDPALALNSPGDPSRTHNCEDLDDAERDVEKNRLKLIITKRLDDEIAKGTDSATWDSALSNNSLLTGLIDTRGNHCVIREVGNVRDRNDQEEPAVCFEIEERLDDVVPAPLSRYDTHLVGT